MHKTIESVKQSQPSSLQIPIAQSQPFSHNYRDSAVSSPEDYPTPAQTAMQSAGITSMQASDNP
jgi:hypothetical protein